MFDLRRPCRRRHLLARILLFARDVGGPALPVRRRQLSRLLKRLEEPELEALARSLETRGAVDATVSVATRRAEGDGTGGGSNCVLLRRPEPSSSSPDWATTERVSLTCRYLRWPDLGEGEELRRMPFCRRRMGGDGEVECYNPYHWSRVAQANTTTTGLTLGIFNQ